MIRLQTALWSVLAAVVFAVPAAFAQTSLDAQTTVVHSCLDHKGKPRIVGSSDNCRTDESALSWNRVGPQGPQGEPGPMGPVGPKGDKGDMGDIGPMGLMGPMGPKGLDGVDGATGPKGDKGDKGDTGATGATGANGATGPQGPKGDPGGVIIPNIVSYVSSQAFKATADNAYRDIPGLSLSVTLAATGPVTLTWNFSTFLVGGFLATRLAIDGAPVNGTQHIVGNAQYGNSSGQYYATLTPGPHTVTLQYRTATAFSFDPSVEWHTASLQGITYDLQ